MKEFGLNGIIQSNPSKYLDEAYSIVIDDDYIYVGGIDEIPKNFEWRIEKRDKKTGNLIKDFGNNGVIINNPSKEWDEINAIKIDDMYLYIIGYDDNTKKKENQWRIEKRDKNTGNLIKDFGNNGVINSNPSEKSDSALSLTIDDSSIYIAGYDNYMDSKREWLIEKRNKNTGNLVNEFGNNGVIQSNLSKDFDIANSICHDDKFIFITGYDKSIGDRQWRIEKRDKNTGNLVNEFGNNGIININSSIDDDYGIAICVDDINIYFTGNEKTNIYMDWQWRLEKINKTISKK